MITPAQREGALLILEGRGTILDVAREVSRVMGSAGVEGAVIGGVAVVLHGHVRTTRDVDVFVVSPLERMHDALTGAGFLFDPAAREYRKGDVPVQLVTADQASPTRDAPIEIDGITTVSLADLVNMKLASGTRDLLRAQDLADVIGLIRCHGLRGDFAARLDKGVRAEFRKLAKAVAERG